MALWLRRRRQLLRPILREAHHQQPGHIICMAEPAAMAAMSLTGHIKLNCVHSRYGAMNYNSYDNGHITRVSVG